MSCHYRFLSYTYVISHALMSLILISVMILGCSGQEETSTPELDQAVEQEMEGEHNHGDHNHGDHNHGDHHHGGTSQMGGAAAEGGTQTGGDGGGAHSGGAEGGAHSGGAEGGAHSGGAEGGAHSGGVEGGAQSGGVEGGVQTGPSPETLCDCVFLNCHEAYHNKWGDDEIEARSNCLDEARFISEEGARGEALLCQLNICESLTTPDQPICLVAVGDEMCND